MIDTSARPALNGLDLGALEELAARVKADPRCRSAAVRVHTKWAGRTRSETRVESLSCGGERIERGFTIVADEPGELLGADSAPSPLELIMTALNACMVVGYVAQASIRGITLSECRIETEGELDLRGFLGIDAEVPPGCRRINYVVHLGGNGTRAQFEDIHEAVMATSPNYFNLAQPVQMRGRLA